MTRRSRRVYEPNESAVSDLSDQREAHSSAHEENLEDKHEGLAKRADDSPVSGGKKKPRLSLSPDVEDDVEELSDSRKERLLKNVMDCLVKDWHPLDPEQNPLDITDFEELLGQFEHAWMFRRSMTLAFKKLLIGRGVTLSKEKAAIFALAIEQALELDDSDGWNDSVYVQRLYDCCSLEDFQQALWGCGLINPGALMAKIYAWCHPEKLPEMVAKEVSMESFWRDLFELPFCGGQCDPILLALAKGCTWEVCLRYGTHVMRDLMRTVPDWWKRRTPSRSLKFYKDLFAETNMPRESENYVQRSLQV